jgi:hypothetical protein
MPLDFAPPFCPRRMLMGTNDGAIDTVLFPIDPAFGIGLLLQGFQHSFCLPLCALLVLTDGWSAYPGSIRRAFREKVKRAGKRGHCQLHAWPELVIGTVIEKTTKHPVIKVIRRIAQGTIERAEELLALSAGGIPLNPAFIERFNGTMRERLASLTRRSRQAARCLAVLEAGMWLVGWTSNFCWPHHELSQRIARAQGRRGDVLISPATAARLIDHLWRVRALLSFHLAPLPYMAPKQRGRPKKTEAVPSRPSSGRPGPLLRLRKGTFCPSTR